MQSTLFFGYNTIFILDSGNKLYCSWVVIGYTQVRFTPSISISDINTNLTTPNFDVVFVDENYSYVDSLNDYIVYLSTENGRQIVRNSI